MHHILRDAIHMQHMLREANAFTEPTVMNRLRIWLMILSGALAIALWMNMEASNPGTIAHLPSISKDFWMDIWAMLLDFADACAADFRDFINAWAPSHTS